MGGAVSWREAQSGKEGEGESEKRGWRNRRVSTKEGEDRAHFFLALSNGTSSISPKRSLQSTKLLISNERPWNTVAKQLREGAYRAADSFPLGVHHYNFFSTLIDFHADEQRPAPNDQAQENGLLRQSCKLHQCTPTSLLPGEQDFTGECVCREPLGGKEKHRDTSWGHDHDRKKKSGNKWKIKVFGKSWGLLSFSLFPQKYISDFTANKNDDNSIFFFFF